MNTRMGARPWLAHTQHAYATMLLARNQPGDDHKAAALLDEALHTARDLSMRALEERLTARLGQTILPLTASHTFFSRRFVPTRSGGVAPPRSGQEQP